MPTERFEEMAEEAWQTIPEDFRNRFENVAVFVQDEPSREHLAHARVPRSHTLFGLYEGVPLDRRGHGYTFALPDRVTLFEGPIRRAARSPEEVWKLVYDTLWHELAHHLGMSEEEVRGAERRRAAGPGD